MRGSSLFVTILLIVFSCNTSKVSDDVIVEGDVEGLPSGKVYLTEAHHYQILLDSTECINGHFRFDIKTDRSFNPYKASIWFTDSVKGGRNSLVYRNHMRNVDSMLYGSNGFYLEKGHTRIVGKYNTKPSPRVFAGKETDLLYKYHAGFGSLPYSDTGKRLAIINFYKRQIKQHPYSYFFLRELFNWKEAYSEGEWIEILSLFEESVQKSSFGKEVAFYLANRTDPGTPYPNLMLLNSNNQRSYIISSAAKLNMVVFWASWCGPCRLEIPVIKELEKTYGGNGLNIVSVSIDKDQEAWRKALNFEKMRWPQFVVDSVNLEKVRAQFNFNAIPLVVFTNSQGMEIARFVGYGEDQGKLYETVIKKYLN